MRSKEEKRIAQNIAGKKSYAKNREKRLANQNKYYTESKIERLAYQGKYYEARRLPYYIVYGLPMEMYCGITNQPEMRMSKHRSESNDTEGYFIISIHKTKSEALEAENAQHQKGWLGSLKSYPAQEIFKNTLVSVITGDTIIESKI